MRLLVSAAIVVLTCCDEDPKASEPDAFADSGIDAAPDSALDAGPEIVPWQRELAPSTRLGKRRGLSIARAVIHFHSPLSHDACDGEGTVDGAIDEICLSEMRLGICQTRQDLVFMTDHDAFHADFEFADVLLMRQGDVALQDGEGRSWAVQMACPDGHRPIVLTGEENELMPIGLHEHPSLDPAVRHDVYDGADAQAAQALRAAGALILIPHAEQRTLEHIVEVQAVGMEIYNFHSNIDPDIREEFLGLEAGDAIANVLTFLLDPASPEPDLVITALFDENVTDLGKWDTLLGRFLPITGFAGNDVHQNSFPGEMADGERGDSYRRLLRWLSNYLLVDEISPEAAESAITQGRLYVAFDAYGTPDGFDFHASSDCGETVEMGGQVDFSCGPVLTVSVPTVLDLDPAGTQPTFRAAIVRVAEGVRELVATDSGGELTFEPGGPGVYRAVVWITPEHLRPYYHGADGPYVRELPWIYSNPIRVMKAE